MMGVRGYIYYTVLYAALYSILHHTIYYAIIQYKGCPVYSVAADRKALKFIENLPSNW